jgi:hypothetical protein
MAWCLVKHRDNFTFTFYENEKWFLTFREEYNLQVFVNKLRKILGIKKGEITEQFRMLRNEEGSFSNKSLDSSVSIQTSCGLDDRASISDRRREFSLQHCVAAGM